MSPPKQANPFSLTKIYIKSPSAEGNFFDYFLTTFYNIFYDILKSYKNEKALSIGLVLFLGGVGETRTLAPGINRPTPLAGEPRHQLEYNSMVALK